MMSLYASGDLRENFRGFIVHCYADPGRNRLYCAGRLDDGRSFAAVEEAWRPYIHVFEEDRKRVLSRLASLRFRECPSDLESFSGRDKLFRLDFFRYGDRLRAADLLEAAGIPSPDADIKPAVLFLAEKMILGPVLIEGRARAGRRAGVVILEPRFTPCAAPAELPLLVASIDIETDTHDNSIRAIAVVSAQGADMKADGGAGNGIVRVRLPQGAGTAAGTADGDGGLFFHEDEASLLAAFFEDIRRMDPDILTGWNFLDFDFRIIAERCGKLGVPFRPGRSSDEGKFFPGKGRRSAAAIAPGRQVIDALRIVRSGFQGSSRGPGDFTLEAVSRAVLGEGKAVASSGKNKVADLDRLYAEDPRLFGGYCRRDAELVLRILAKTGLFTLTVKRALLTGAGIDKAWTSVVSFERIYGIELARRNTAMPPPNTGDVSGAAGGTVLDPLPGLFGNVAVFDFRSLYPTIIRTFNIDPLARARSGAPERDDAGPPLLADAALDAPPEDGPITAPNGASFSRSPGVLPSLIAEYFKARRKAMDEGDETAAWVYKILMNSFYGVMGTSACRYGRTDLAGAITSFARKWLYLSRDWFTERGFRVLYGDTDSLFVETGFGDQAAPGDFLVPCGKLAGELNGFLSETIRKEYRLESFMELRFEKAYRRFLIPPLRAPHAGTASSSGGREGPRGRAKGYGGYLVNADGSYTVEVKGMEAVRSDATPLARRLQVELLELVFSGADEDAFRKKIQGCLEDLRSGKLDGELVYRKRLSRPPESYTSSTPPQVKAARALGWKGRRGAVEFVWTQRGAEPYADENRVLLPHSPLDYDHYADSQVLPVALSIASAIHWDISVFFEGKNSRRHAWENGQAEFDFG
ncbi:MAG: DNA polymerase II [Treponema sp.]|jgi:DNA polymerase-2|nr:DNA polymerase II [Treponema sp.]